MEIDILTAQGHMDYHLDRKIRFAREKDTNLYQWSLQEFTADGQSVGSKQIPWGYSLFFTANEMRYVHHSSSEIYPSDDPRYQPSPESIRISISPVGSSDGRAPRFLMFGTDRVIKSFSLAVRCTENEHAPQRCTAWGLVRYTYEIDFREETTEDEIGFEIWLSPHNFNSLRQVAQHGSGEYSLSLRVGGVHGFYSNWSPSVTTDNVKVLTHDKAQMIHGLEDIDEVWRLGQVADFNLNVAQRRVLEAWDPKHRTAISNRVTEQIIEQASSAASDIENPFRMQMLAEMNRIQDGIAKLCIPLWLLLLVAITTLFLGR